MKPSTRKIIFFIVIALLSIGHIFTISLEPYDELWNFQNIYKLYCGNEIYSDANIIVTPLFFILGLVFFNIFGASIITFRIYNIFICILFFAILYNIFKTLKVSNHLNLLFIGLTLTQTISVINGGANYNILAFAFVLLGIWTYLKFFDKKFFNYLQGFIIFLIFFTKQNIGIYYTLGILIFEFVYRKNLLSYVLDQLKKLLTFILPLLISIIILCINNRFSNFLNYCFGGISEFGITNLIFSASPSIVIFIGIIVALYLFIIFFRNKFDKNVFTNERTKNLHLLGIVAICTSLSIYPIANTAHFLYVFPLYTLLLFYFLDFSILEEILDKKHINNTYILAILIFIFIVLKMFFSFIYEKNSYIRVNDESNPFDKISLSQNNYEKMNTMTTYIKEKNKQNVEVIIISYDSALSMVPLNQNNQAFDLVFNGNLGANGENKLIEKIKHSSNTEFLILSNKDDFYWQDSITVRNFIIENLEKKGEILNYSIYTLPNTY